jgi:hypothetical protein
MHKKIMVACFAVAAFAAFAIAPATSSAHWLKETVGGQPIIIPAGAKVVAYSEEGQPARFQGSNGWFVECDENILTGSVHANHDVNGNVQITIEDVWFQGHEPETQCTSTMGPAKVTIPAVTNFGGGAHWCIKTLIGTDKFLLEPHNCTGVGGSFTFVVHMGGLKCAFERKENMEGTFTTGDVGNQPVTFKLNPNQKFVTDLAAEHSFLCPPEWTLNNVLFQLYTDTGPTSNQYRNPVDTVDPVFMTE